MACPLSNAETLLNIAYHVFLPPQLPQQAPCDDHEQQINRRLALLAHDAIENYRSLVVDDSGQWAGMSRMLSRLAQTVETPFTQHRLQDDMSQMQADDVIALHIHQQNAAVLVRKSATTTTFEIFEVQAPNESVMSVPGKLVRHFPGPAIQIPNSTANDSGFIEEISNFLSRMNIDILEDAMAKTTKAGSKVAEVRDSADPHYISQLFTGILRGFGQEVEPRRIIKRIADEVLWNNTYLPWCRSPIWLIVRVALQTSLESADDYKNFMAYFHAYLLGLCCVEDSFPDDLLSTMRAKMARRLLKVQGFVPACVVEAAKAASGQTEKILRGRWNAIQADIPRFQPLTLDTDQAVAQSLPNSRTYLSEVIQGRSGRNKNSSFNPNHRPRLSGRPDFAEFANGALTTAFNDNKHIALFDFEHAVHNHLPTWVDNNRNQPTSCATIFSCFEQYISAALSYYTHDVADRSIMILTVMELWVALDRVATSQHGLLLEYSPEIPEDLIEVLLLRSSLHLERANMVQSYLRRRHADGETAGRGSVFTSKATSNSLPVRFFQQSRSLQVLKQDIEREARRQRQEKIEELHRLNAEHARLMTSISQSSCDTFVDRWGNRVHDRWCTKCSKADQAKKMRILLHEWPLPSNELDASAVVFELECPEALNLWRSATYKILCDLAGSFRDGKASPHCTLAGYDGLTKWSYPLRSSDHRITIASSTKSFLDSHYSPTSIPALESTVCVNNGLTFALFDSTDDAWAAGPFTEASVAKYGTFTLPSDSPYRYLQPALKGTSHTSNQILADQSDCPKDLSLHEHYAYGTLRSGPRLQWMNIARGLEENSLTFSSEEVDLLHTQAAWQIGRLSRDSQARGWHLELADSQFGYLLVTQALRVLDCVRANWLEATSVRTIVMLVTRLLSSTTDSNTQFEAYRFLREARAVTYGWLGELSTKLQDAELESQVLDYQQRVCEMAAICRSTYDVDAPHLPGLLLNQEDCLALVSCSVALYDNQPPQLEKAPRHLRALLSRDRRLAHKVLPFMLEKIRDMPRLLDDSVSRYWDGYCPGSGDWEALPAPNSRWVRTTTAATSTEVSQQVHLNLLKVLNVVPAKSPGMVFSTRTHVDGNQVLFCLEENSGELIVRSRRNRATFQLIPHSELAKDFPRFFSSDYHHWIDLETGLVEFRPLAAPWSSDDKNWHLEFSASSASCMRQIGEQGSILLADMHSRFFKDVACQIDPLEDPQYLHITQCSRDPARITVELPRMKLAFFINEDRRLESSNLSGQVIDEAQSTGTMLGLVNQLVLRPRDSTAKSFPQSNVVLIPSGKVDFRLQNHHARVTINRGSGRHVNFYQYKVDMDLGYLTSNNTSLTSRLFKIYLHAVTSHCLPDPLTGRTGTEEALHELSEAATSSFDQINQEQARLLQLIGALTPQRVYYPANLKSMQTTKWIDIPCLAQHYAFCTAVNTILERARSLQLFNPLTFDLDPYITEFDTNLLKRTAHRTRIYYPSDVTARLSTILGESEDRSCWYEGRDHQSNGWTEKGQLASWASGLVHDRWGKPTYLSCNLVSQLESWGNVSAHSRNLNLGYNTDWLHLHLPTSWITLYNLSRQSSTTGNQYQLGICLAAATYGEQLPQNLVPILAAVAMNSAFQHLAPPSHLSYHLSDKYRPTQARIQALISSACLHIEETPANNISRNTNESAHNWDRRRKTNYDENISTFKSQLTQTWFNCWPSTPPTPSGPYSSWFDIAGCLEQVRAYFDSCSRNADLRDHLHNVESELSSGPMTPCLDFTSMPSALPRPRSRSFSAACPLDLLHLDQLMKVRACPDVKGVRLDSSLSVSTNYGCPPNTASLKQLLAEFHSASACPLHRRYGTDLEASRKDLALANPTVLPNQPPSSQLLEANRQLYQVYLQETFNKIETSLSPSSDVENIVLEAGVWPRLTPRTLLGRLALWARSSTPRDWEGRLVTYARAYVEYQRSQRLISLATEEKYEEFYKELNHSGLPNTEVATDNPDWLLVQIEGNFGARTIQAQCCT